MNARRRYDTTALIQDLKTDRRKGIGLTLAAVVVILVLVGLYVSQIGGGTPEVPGSADPIQRSPEEKQAALDAALTDKGDKDAAQAKAEPEPEPPPPANATVAIVLPRKGQLWVDDESVGKVKSHSAELPPGEHTFKAKVGRKTVEQTETLAPGSKVQLTVKKKRMVLKVIESGEAAAEEPTPSEDDGAEE